MVRSSVEYLDYFSRGPSLLSESWKIFNKYIGQFNTIPKLKATKLGNCIDRKRMNHWLESNDTPTYIIPATTISLSLILYHQIQLHMFIHSIFIPKLLNFHTFADNDFERIHYTYIHRVLLIKFFLVLV